MVNQRPKGAKKLVKILKTNRKKITLSFVYINSFVPFTLITSTNEHNQNVAMANVSVDYGTYFLFDGAFL